MTPTSMLAQVARGTKRCPSCGRNKNLAEYSLNGKTHRPMPRCKQCVADSFQQGKERRRKNGPKKLPQNEIRSRDVVEFLGVSTWSVNNYANEGKITRIRRGIFDRASVQAFADQKSKSRTRRVPAPEPLKQSQPRASALITLLGNVSTVSDKLYGAALIEPRLLSLANELGSAITTYAKS